MKAGIIVALKQTILAVWALLTVVLCALFLSKGNGQTETRKRREFNISVAPDVTSLERPKERTGASLMAPQSSKISFIAQLWFGDSYIPAM